MTALSRDEIRESVPCPVCRAKPGTFCFGRRKGKNHFERMQAAQRLHNADRRIDREMALIERDWT